jgi:YfiH family protein
VKMRKAGRVHYLEPESFAGKGMSVQGFTTRHEGVSRQPYNSLNLGINTFDSRHNVQGNRSILSRAFGIRAERLVTVNQVHGLDLLVIDTPNPEYDHFLKLECDGLITNQPGVMIGVCVADCVPVLLLDPVKKVVAALHAGWKGTAGDIVGNGISSMVEMFDSRPADIMAAVGPAIGKCCYEVDSPVVEAFRKSVIGMDCFDEGREPGRWRLDLGAANHRLLLAAGLMESNISISRLCVSCEHDLFFSYRRDNGDTGRQMGFIMLNLNPGA